MANAITNRIDDLKGSFEQLSARERRMIGALGATFVIGVIVVVGYIVVSGLEEIEENNASMRKALRVLERNKRCYMMHRRRNARLEIRMSGTPLELNRFVETRASAVGVTISESDEISPVPLDRFVQRGVEIKLRKISIEQLGQLIKELESSPRNIVQVTELSVTTRWKQHKELDVEMTVSTFQKRRREVDESNKRKRGKRAGRS